jgi:UDP-glucose 4-epimerase
MSQGPLVRDGSFLITGGCGFIGSHLTRALLAGGARRVVVVDSLRYGDPANLGSAGDRVELVRHTLGHDDPAPLARALAGVDGLFHLAAEKHNQSIDSPIDVLRSNVEGSFTLFDLAARAGVGKIVFSSSLYAYGRMAGPPFSEDEVPHPTTVYGISKLTGEHLLAHVGKIHGVAWNVLRYLFVYGPRQFAGMGYKSVIVKNGERLLGGERPAIFGDGRQALDYVFVDDVVDATLRAMERDVSGETINIGSGRATSVEELIATLIAQSKKALTPLHEPADWTAGSVRVGDVDKARRLLDWSATTSLADGLGQTLAWMAEGGART